MNCMVLVLHGLCQHKTPKLFFFKNDMNKKNLKLNQHYRRMIGFDSSDENPLVDYIFILWVEFFFVFYFCGCVLLGLPRAGPAWGRTS